MDTVRISEKERANVSKAIRSRATKWNTTMKHMKDMTHEEERRLNEELASINEERNIQSLMNQMSRIQIPSHIPTKSSDSSLQNPVFQAYKNTMYSLQRLLNMYNTERHTEKERTSMEIAFFQLQGTLERQRKDVQIWKRTLPIRLDTTVYDDYCDWLLSLKKPRIVRGGTRQKRQTKKNRSYTD